MRVVNESSKLLDRPYAAIAASTDPRISSMFPISRKASASTARLALEIAVGSPDCLAESSVCTRDCNSAVRLKGGVTALRSVEAAYEDLLCGCAKVEGERKPTPKITQKSRRAPWNFPESNRLSQASTD